MGRMESDRSPVLELHPRHGTHQPTTATPPRAPGSVLRTSSIDMLRPDGLTGHLELAGMARDLVTGLGGEPSVASEAAMQCTIASWTTGRWRVSGPSPTTLGASCSSEPARRPASGR